MNEFAAGVAEKLGFYVYLLIDPRDDDVFYVGKGTWNRCFAHIFEAHETQADTIGDYAKLARIREIESAGTAVRIELLRHGLSEREALLVESAAIDLLGLEELDNRVSGYAAGLDRMSATDANALYGATPVELDPRHRVVLIRINRLFERGMSDDELYEATRQWWVVGPLRRQLGAPTAPDWAMAVFGGVVRAVYRIDKWERPTDEDIAGEPKRRIRWRFEGQRDLEMEKLYLHRDVWRYLRDPETGRASQNPMRYVNCGEISSEGTVTQGTESSGGR